MWENLENIKGQQKDVLIISMPLIETLSPMAAPAVLKASAERAGFSCLAVDANALTINWIKNHQKKKYFLDFFTSNVIHEEVEKDLYEYYSTFVDNILSWNPQWVALSLLITQAQISVQWLCYFLKKRNQQIKIVIGGPGCGISAAELGNFVPDMIKMGLIDFHVRGDGEISFVECLKGNKNYPGINGNPIQYLSDQQIAELPIPDYTDYRLENFEDPVITVTGSKGCVRQCQFCDYIEFHKKFQWRTAQSIFAEMLHQANTYQIYTFSFSDSLINGNAKEFNMLINLLADYNEKNPNKKFSWSSHYIIRNRSSGDEQLWKTLSKSGCRSLWIGVESLTQHIRYEMGKKIDDESVLHHLYLAKKYKVHVTALMMVGYPNETEKDLEFTKQWFKEHADLADVMHVNLQQVEIQPGTQLDRLKSSRFGIIIDETNSTKDYIYSWKTTKFGTNNNWEFRNQWLQDIKEVLIENGFSIQNSFDDVINHFYNNK